MTSPGRRFASAIARRAGRWWDSPTTRVVRLLPSVSRSLTALLAATVLAGALLSAASILASGLLVSSALDAARGGPSSPAAPRALVATAVLAAAFSGSQVLTRLSAALAAILGVRLDLELQQRVIRAVNAPHGTRHLDDPAIQDLVARAAGVGVSGYTPGDAVQGLSGKAGPWLQGALAAVLLVPYHWWVALLVVGAQLLRARVARRDYLRQTRAVAQQTRLVRRSGYFRDLALTPGAAKEIRLLGLPDWVAARFRAEWLSAMALVWAERRSGRWPTVAVIGAAAAANLATYALVGLDAVRGAIGAAALVVYLRAADRVGSLAGLGAQDLQIAYGAAAVPAVLALEAAVADAGHRSPGGRSPARAPAPRTGIAFRGLRFAYPASRTPVLDGLDLFVPAGRSLAVVGANGAGKSTLVKLLCRLHEPDAGTIAVDGVDLREIDARAWQRQIAAIFQDFTRYELPARDNVGFGAIERSGDRAALERAAAGAGILERIEALPGRWETPLARHLRGGAELSGGEWQRVALARALLAVEAGAGVLVLDEPTASLDLRAEAEFYDRFLDLTRGLTTILISHRFASVRRADRICVLEGGRVAELGSHDELVARGGSYARMFALQSALFIGAGA